MDTTLGAVSPPLPTPQTPHFPGYFPETPSDSSDPSSAYDQREPPLDAAGRALPLPTGSVLLGAAAGLILGGPLGAAAGASLAGLREMERTALSARVGNAGALAEGQTAVEREVGGLGGEGDQLLKGATGAKVLDLEVPQIRTVDVDEEGVPAVEDHEKVSLVPGVGDAGGGIDDCSLCRSIRVPSLSPSCWLLELEPRSEASLHLHYDSRPSAKDTIPSVPLLLCSPTVTDL